MEDNLNKNKMEDDLKNKMEDQNQSTKINLIGCDTIVNSPSFRLSLKVLKMPLCVESCSFCAFRRQEIFLKKLRIHSLLHDYYSLGSAEVDE